MNRGFWKNLAWPVVGLAPMDGVTDAAFRYIVAKYGRKDISDNLTAFPSLFMTEFTNVEGLARGVAEMLKAFIYSEIERPIVGQIYGVEVDSFYKSSLMLCRLGFDGIDINMGCPANKVAKHGSGAGLIRTPDLAKKIVLSCKKAAKDWAEGITLEEANVPATIIERIEELQPEEPERKELPVSVKTRIGFEKPVTEEWMKHLLEVRPANITLHGRTLRQMYLGKADWDEIAKAAKLCHENDMTLIGNGDVENLADSFRRIKEFGVDGVLVGRATFGNPWFFNEHEPTVEERFAVLLEHARYFTQLNHLYFHNIKKHLAWYCKGFDGARELRMRLMGTQSLEDVEKVVEEFKKR